MISYNFSAAESRLSSATLDRIQTEIRKNLHENATVRKLCPEATDRDNTLMIRYGKSSLLWINFVREIKHSETGFMSCCGDDGDYTIYFEHDKYGLGRFNDEQRLTEDYTITDSPDDAFEEGILEILKSIE